MYIGIQPAAALKQRIADRAAVDREAGFGDVDDFPPGRNVLVFRIFNRFGPLLFGHDALLAPDRGGADALHRLDAAAGHRNDHQTAVAQLPVRTAVGLLQRRAQQLERFIHIVDFAFDDRALAGHASLADDLDLAVRQGFADQHADLGTAQIDGSHDFPVVEHGCLT